MQMSKKQQPPRTISIHVTCSEKRQDVPTRRQNPTCSNVLYSHWRQSWFYGHQFPIIPDRAMKGQPGATDAHHNSPQKLKREAQPAHCQRVWLLILLTQQCHSLPYQVLKTWVGKASMVDIPNSFSILELLYPLVLLNQWSRVLDRLDDASGQNILKSKNAPSWFVQKSCTWMSALALLQY